MNVYTHSQGMEDG